MAAGPKEPATMTPISPVAQQAFKELKGANAVLLRAMAREKRARATLTDAGLSLAVAKRNVQLLLQAVQPELPDAGPSESAEAGVATAALDQP
jgi:hypothetical protein